MKIETYQATLSRSQNRSAWAIIFRHPLRNGRDGRPGLRVRRGLGTSDDLLAQNLVDQMNEILSDPTLWIPGARVKAEQKYDSKIVAAFYDNLLPELFDPWSVRDAVIPLPSKTDGYARVLLVGTTGAGKTTLVRQLIGTNPKTERFPSTSASKTTISNIEIVIRQSIEFEAVVSFFTRSYVREHIEECVIAAVKACIDKSVTGEIERKLLEHSEQRFRLSYLLGTSKTLSIKSSDEEISDIETDDEEITDRIDEVEEKSQISQQERSALLETLSHYIIRVHSLANTSMQYIESLGVSFDSANGEETDALYELLEDDLYSREEFAELVDQILEDIESRFDQLLKGEVLRDKNTGWPSHWIHKSSDRMEFIDTINRFSSNYAPNFGQLLTPIVEGIRVSGPFSPSWYKEDDYLPLVLLDGEGLGHTPESASSISTSITKRFQLVDAILLVDNAAQPMQGGSTAVLQSLVSSGHHSKLIIGFTHFDEVTGPNIPSVSMRKEHVLSSFDNAINSVGKRLGSRAENVLKECRNNRIFFLSKIQNSVKVNERNLSYTELVHLVKAIQATIEPPVPTEVIPLYDDANLVLNIQQAALEFHIPWRARLKLEFNSNVKPEHWTRIKALTRRLGDLGQDEYDNLKPVADLLTRLADHIYLFVENPLSWEPGNAPEHMQQLAINAISKEVDARLHSFVSDILFRMKTPEWYRAFSYSGRGSSTVRALEIRNIYDSAAPIPGEVPTSGSNQFIQEIRKLVREAIEAGGGLVP